MAIFQFLKMAAAIMLDLQIFKILTVGTPKSSRCVIMPNFLAIGKTFAKIGQFFPFFQ